MNVPSKPWPRAWKRCRGSIMRRAPMVARRDRCRCGGRCPGSGHADDQDMLPLRDGGAPGLAEDDPAAAGADFPGREVEAVEIVQEADRLALRDRPAGWTERLVVAREWGDREAVAIDPARPDLGAGGVVG